jgi:hypothetical protein
MGIPKVTGGAVQPRKPLAAPVVTPAANQPTAIDDFVARPKTFADLDLSTQRAARDQLKALLPASTPAYRAVVALVTSDAFAKLTPAAQQAQLRTVASITTSPWFAGLTPAAQKALVDPKVGPQLGSLLANKGFAALDVKTQAKVATAFVNPQLTDDDRGVLSAALTRPALAKLDPQVKNALVGALAKSPADTELAGKLQAVVSSAAFRQMPRAAQVGFLHAVELHTDVVMLENDDAKQAALLTLVASPEFRKLDPAAQKRWMTALGSDVEATRNRTHRLAAPALDRARPPRPDHEPAGHAARRLEDQAGGDAQQRDHRRRVLQRQPQGLQPHAQAGQRLPCEDRRADD